MEGLGENGQLLVDLGPDVDFEGWSKTDDSICSSQLTETFRDSVRTRKRLDVLCLAGAPKII